MGERMVKVSGGITAVSIEEGAGKIAHEVFHTHRNEIEDAVEHGRGQNLPGEHHAQHGEGVEEQHREHGGEQRGAERGEGSARQEARR